MSIASVKAIPLGKLGLTLNTTKSLRCSWIRVGLRVRSCIRSFNDPLPFFSKRIHRIDKDRHTKVEIDSIVGREGCGATREVKSIIVGKLVNGTNLTY